MSVAGEQVLVLDGGMGRELLRIGAPFQQRRRQPRGRLRGHRTIWGGRAPVRTALYMATLVATRYNPLIQAQYQEMLRRGKVKKVALTACMRKFLTILNAMMRDQVPFRQRDIA